MVDNKAISHEVMERAFNNSDLTAIDEHMAPDGVDHQEPPGTDLRAHLKEVVVGLHRAFPDLHFEMHDILAEGDNVAFRATMTGTQQGPLNVGPARGIPATNRKVTVAHLYLVRMIDGKVTDLWHTWDTLGMLRQLGVIPEPQR
jgi:predicted ester cyclase